jgi:hypothetical protein
VLAASAVPAAAAAVAVAALPILHPPPGLTPEEEGELALVLQGLNPYERRVFATLRAKMSLIKGQTVCMDLRHAPPIAMRGIAAALAFDTQIGELQLGGRTFPHLPSVISRNTTIRNLIAAREACGNALEVMQACVENPLFENLGFQDFQQVPGMAATVEAAVGLFAKHFACSESLGLGKLAVGHERGMPSDENPEHLALFDVLPLFRALAAPRLCQHMLTGLSLTGLVVADHAMASEVFGKVIASPDCELQNVKLFANFDPVVIGEALKLNRSIHLLQWTGNELGPLCSALCVNSTISNLDVARSFGAGLAQGRAFAAAVPMFRGVRRLRFPYELVDDETLLEFGRSLTRAKHFCSIAVCRMTLEKRFLGEAALREFVSLLPLFPGIEKFGLSGNWMENPLALASEMHSLTLGRFHYETDRISFDRVPGPEVRRISVRFEGHTEEFQIPSAFPLASILNRVGEHFDTSTHRLSLIRCSDRMPVISSHSSIESARQTIGEYFSGQDPVELYVSRGDFAAVGFAFQRAKEALESFVSTRAETARVRQGRKRSADGDLGAPSKATRAEGQEEVSDSATPVVPPPPLITERTLRENGISLLGTIPIDAMRVLDYFVNGSG